MNYIWLWLVFFKTSLLISWTVINLQCVWKESLILSALEFWLQFVILKVSYICRWYYWLSGGICEIYVPVVTWQKCIDNVKFMAKFFDKSCIDCLRMVASAPFEPMTYTKEVELLEGAVKKDLEWGDWFGVRAWKMLNWGQSKASYCVQLSTRNQSILHEAYWWLGDSGCCGCPSCS